MTSDNLAKMTVKLEKPENHLTPSVYTSKYCIVLAGIS